MIHTSDENQLVICLTCKSIHKSHVLTDRHTRTSSKSHEACGPCGGLDWSGSQPIISGRFGGFLTVIVRKEGNVLYNDALNTLYLRLHGVSISGRKEGRKCLFNDALNTFYFTVIWHRTYGKGPFRRKEGNVLFNNALNTFYFTVILHWTYGKGPLR